MHALCLSFRPLFAARMDFREWETFFFGTASKKGGNNSNNDPRNDCRISPVACVSAELGCEDQGKKRDNDGCIDGSRDATRADTKRPESEVTELRGIARAIVGSKNRGTVTCSQSRSVFGPLAVTSALRRLEFMPQRAPAAARSDLTGFERALRQVHKIA